VSFREPPPTEDDASGSAGSFNSDQTAVQTGPRGVEGLGMHASSYVLERGVDSQGSAPMSFAGGEQQGPISLGRGGQFRIDGRGVLAMHGYLMFDGEGIYLCSADEANPIVADTVRIPREWTRVGVPSTLVFGRTRAVLRVATTASPMKPTPAPPPRKQRTGPMPARPALQRPDVAFDRSTEVKPTFSDDAATPFAGVQQIRGAPADESETLRPRLNAQGDDESTRLGPDLLSLSGSLGSFGDDESTRMNTELPRAGAVVAPRPAAGYPPPKEIQPYVPPMPPGMVAMAAAPQPVYSAPQPAYPPPQVAYAPPPPGYPPPGAGYAPPAQTGPIPAPPEPPVTVTAPVAAGRPSKLPAAVQRAIEALRAGIQPGSPRRAPILAGGLSLTFIFVATLVTVVRLHSSAPANTLPPPPPPPPTSSPTEPVATAVSPGILVYPAPPHVTVDPAVDGGPRAPKGKPGPPPPPTLERNAVDAINRGDMQGALALYKQLAQQQPDNPAFANAVRLLQQRLGPANGGP